MAPEPTVASIEPASGGLAGGENVTITGTGLSLATNVTIGGSAATNITIVSDTSITCTTPAGTVGTASVVVTTPGGANAANTLFTYVFNVPPSFTLSPSSVTLFGFNSPFDLALDSSGRLYVANADGDTVNKFLAGAVRSSLTINSLNGPRALAFDSTGNLYVANGKGDTVSRIEPGGLEPKATLNGLNRPTALALDLDGNLYVANYGVDGTGTTVSRFDAASLASGATTITASATLTGLNGPYALAFDNIGNLYVANFGRDHGE